MVSDEKYIEKKGRMRTNDFPDSAEKAIFIDQVLEQRELSQEEKKAIRKRFGEE